jgi:Ni/Co efflux regulator RcnB/surface antigen
MKKAILTTLALTLLAGTAAQGADNGRRDRDSNYSDRDQHRERAWERGQKVPREYMRDEYIYRDWRESGLRAPPRGSQWMILNGQYVLVGTRNGVVAEIRIVPPRIEHRNGDRNELWRKRYSRAYTYNDDIAYTECRSRPDPAGVLAGAFLGAILGNAAAGRSDRGGATAAGVIAGGAIGAALTSKMDCGDRSYAYQSYSLAFNGGRPGAAYQWTNPQNRHRGEMRVLDYYDDEDDFRCAVFTQTVYINNRPEEARGRACQQPDGNWAIID